MRVKLLVIVLVCGLVEQLSAQTQVKIDSLLHVIIAVSTKDVSNEARELAKLLSTEDAKGLDARAPDVLNALTGVSSVPKITTLLLLGKIYEKDSLAAWAIRFYRESNKQAVLIRDKHLEALSLRSLSFTYYNQGLYT